MGNAFLIREHEPATQGLRDYLAKTGQKMWLIETDFGNFVRLSDNEIKELFHDPDPSEIPARETSYDRWRTDRQALRLKTYVEPSDTLPDPAPTR